MKEIDSLLSQIESTYAGEPWHGPSFRRVIRGITPQIASARVPGEAHTIWELVLHMHGSADVVTRRLEGHEISEPIEGDFPGPPIASTAAWRTTIRKFDATMGRLQEIVASLSPSALNRPVPGRRTPIGEMLHGIIWHNVYHTGQIAILKRAILSAKKKNTRA